MEKSVCYSDATWIAVTPLWAGRQICFLSGSKYSWIFCFRQMATRIKKSAQEIAAMHKSWWHRSELLRLKFNLHFWPPFLLFFSNCLVVHSKLKSFLNAWFNYSRYYPSIHPPSLSLSKPTHHKNEPALFPLSILCIKMQLI